MQERRRPQTYARRARVLAGVVVISLVTGTVGGCGGETGAPDPAGTDVVTATPPAGTSGPSPAESPAPAPGTTPAPAPAAATTDEPPTTDEPATVPAAPAAGPVRGLPTSTATATFVDATRPTVSQGRTLAATRTLRTTFVFPSAGGPYPVVLFAHGYRLGPPGYRRLIDTVAAAGYVVAAPSFPLADADVAGVAVDRADIPNQSGDLRVVLDRLAAGLPEIPPGRVDSTRVGAVGHSDGADTVLDLGYHRDRADARVRAVAALAPDPLTFPGGAATPAPLLLVHGSADSVVPASASGTVFGRLSVPRTFVTLLGADHLPPVQGAAPWAAVLDAAVLALLDEQVAGRPGSTPLATVAAVPGVSSVRQAG